MATSDKKTEAPKPFFTSKTVIVNAVIAIAAIFPPVAQFVAEHPQAILLGITGLNFLLRLVTKGRVVLIPD